MRRPITGFHQDEEGHWVAELACGHQQHVRHEPPWTERPWVITPEGRHSRLGVELDCRECQVEAAGLDQGETRRIFGLMGRLKSADQCSDPLPIIQVVNALQPLGKDGALSIIDRYLRLSDRFRRQGGLFAVVRCLFEIPEPPGYFPVMRLGVPYPTHPEDLRSSPRFPVVLYQDLPFVGILGYSLAGRPEYLGEHLAPYRSFGKMRDQPLRPPDDPFAAADRVVASPEWPDWDGRSDCGLLLAREQVLRLVDPVYRLPVDRFDTRLTGDCLESERQWQMHVDRFAALKVRWDPAKNSYVFPDGALLPPAPEPSE